MTVIVFLYPLIAGVISYFLRHEDASLTIMALLVLAFFGVYLVVGPAFETLNMTGLGLAFFAAIDIAIVIILIDRFIGGFDVLTFNFLNMIGIVVAFIIAKGLVDGWAIEFTMPGILYLFLGACSGSIGQYTLMDGIKKISSVKAGLYLNSEIIVALGASAIFLGQNLQGIQYAGAALVLAALVLEKLRKNPVVS